MCLENFTIWSDAKGYPCIWVDGKSVKVHVYIWELKNGSKPKGHDIHHIDMDKGNYELGNLRLMTQSDHKKLHAGWVELDGEFCLKPCSGCNEVLTTDKFYQRKGLTPSAKCIDCSKRQWKEDARRKGVKARRHNRPNDKGEYQCITCMQWKAKDKHKFSNKNPQSYCKECFNIRQKDLRRIRNGK